MTITITYRSKAVDATEFAERYRHIPQVQAQCGQCTSYGRVWSCPPFAEPFDLTPYRTAVLVGTTIAFDNQTVRVEYEPEIRKSIMTEAIDAAWKTLLPHLYAREREHKGSRIFTGRCRLCSPLECSRISDEPCRHPNRMRSSLEAIGFDVVAATREVLGIELQWARGRHLPATITLITALFTPQTGVTSILLPPEETVLLTEH